MHFINCRNGGFDVDDLFDRYRIGYHIFKYYYFQTLSALKFS